MGNVFDVEGADGRQAKFTGRFVRISPINPSHYFVRLDPGQSLSHDLDLAVDYDLSVGGRYTVRYSQDFVVNVKMDGAGEIASTADAQEASNTAEIIAERSLAAP